MAQAMLQVTSYTALMILLTAPRTEPHLRLLASAELPPSSPVVLGNNGLASA